MIRSRTVNKIHDLAAEGKSIQDIAISLGIARNTVRKYLRHPELVTMPLPRLNPASGLLGCSGFLQRERDDPDRLETD
jgi:hypothetical protein